MREYVDRHEAEEMKAGPSRIRKRGSHYDN